MSCENSRQAFLEADQQLSESVAAEDAAKAAEADALVAYENAQVATRDATVTREVDSQRADDEWTKYINCLNGVAVNPLRR